MKQQKSLVLDEFVVDKVKEDSVEQERSESFIINKILEKYYGDRE